MLAPDRHLVAAALRRGWPGRAGRSGPARAGLETVRRDRRAEILATTLSPPPEHLGVTHWSTRLLADQLGCSHSTVARVWAEHDLKPWRTETFKFSTDPQLEAKVRDVVGLYLDPPEHAIVVCVDEKAQIQALSRTAPNLPLRPGSPERRTHDYVRHGTTTLFAALEVATGRVVDQCFEQHRHGEFLAFLKLVAKAYPRRQLQVVLDNYGTHTHATVQAWLAKHPRVTALHPDLGELDEPGRGVLFDHHPPGDPAGQLCPALPIWWPPSAASATPGTSAATPLSGSKTPTTSWSRQPVNEPQVRNTSPGVRRLGHSAHAQLWPVLPDRPGVRVPGRSPAGCRSSSATS